MTKIESKCYGKLMKACDEILKHMSHHLAAFNGITGNASTFAAILDLRLRECKRLKRAGKQKTRKLKNKTIA